jgi:Na+/proline symporter
MTLPAGLIFFFLGTALYVFYRTFPQNLDPNLETDAILPWFIVHELPSGLAGLVVAAIFAATMSSLDSSMNSMATVFVTDFYQRLKPDATDHFRLRLARIITIVLGAFATGCALLLARYPIKSLWDLFLVLLGLLGGTLAGVFVLGIFTRRANSLGAMIGIVCSTLALFCAKQYTQIHFFLYGAVGIITCVCVGYLGSFLSRLSKPCPRDFTVYGLFKRAED